MKYKSSLRIDEKSYKKENKLRIGVKIMETSKPKSRKELQNIASRYYGSHEYSIFIKKYINDIANLDYEDQFILLKTLYINSKEGNDQIGELLQYLAIIDIPSSEYKNIKDNINFDKDGKAIVYRGLNRFNNKEGTSYTLDKNKAIWFSKRFGDDINVIEKSISIDDIIFYSNVRNEQEVFIKSH